MLAAAGSSWRRCCSVAVADLQLLPTDLGVVVVADGVLAVAAFPVLCPLELLLPSTALPLIAQCLSGVTWPVGTLASQGRCHQMEAPDNCVVRNSVVLPYLGGLRFVAPNKALRGHSCSKDTTFTRRVAACSPVALLSQWSEQGPFCCPSCPHVVVVSCRTNVSSTWPLSPSCGYILSP